MAELADIARSILKDAAAKRALAEAYEHQVIVCAPKTNTEYHRRKVGEFLEIAARYLGFELVPADEYKRLVRGERNDA